LEGVKSATLLENGFDATTPATAMMAIIVAVAQKQLSWISN